MKSRIRPYAPPDENAVLELWDACGLVRPVNDPVRDIQRKLQVQPELFLVAELDARVIGTLMAGYEGHRGWINYLAVAPSMQKSGVGRELMHHAETLLLTLGCPKINLQVRTNNTQVIAFYERLGYAQDDVVSLGKRLIVDDVP
jgi:ribosomal protein S18 acetylase RimI-like enzyme